MKMFNEFDVNGNGYLSLAELDKGIRDVLVIPQMFDMKPPILRAYYASKDKGKARTKYSDDYDERISRQEFIDGQEMLERWVGPIMDIEAEFEKVDSDGHGMILFKEFAEWAIEKGLDLEDDDDYDQGNFTG